MFRNRQDAGRLLSEKLEQFRNTNSIVLAIPRGGIPVALEISKALHIPIDVILCKKIGHPQNEEVAIGAVCTQGMIIDNNQQVPKEYIKRKAEEIKNKLKAQLKLFRGNRSFPDVQGKNVILVDDGIATGYTLLATIRMLRTLNPAQIIVAVPVASSRSARKIERECDELICLTETDYFPGVGAFYQDFSQVSDEEAIELLSSADQG